MTAEIDAFKQEFLSPREARMLLSLLFAGFAFWCTVSCLLPHDRYIRYQQPGLLQSYLFRTRWVYERIHFDKTPIDIAVIGSSRAEDAISAPILGRALSRVGSARTRR